MLETVLVAKKSIQLLTKSKAAPNGKSCQEVAEVVVEANYGRHDVT